jgi:hypothetical protein
MTLKQGLIRARSHIAMMVGLIIAFGLVIHLENWQLKGMVQNPLMLNYHAQLPLVTPRQLTQEELMWAQIAWKYFENNIQPNTGLANSVDKYPATTMWDTASYLMGLISAYRLEIISEFEFDRRMSNALNSLARLPLFEDALPNKSYNTMTLEMSNYDNTPNPRGIGWSALDVGRLLVPLHIVAWHYPTHTPTVQRILRRWQWGKLSDNGQMIGARVSELDKTEYVQEGRLGYEQYGAKSLALAGLDMSIAGSYTAFLKEVSIYGIPVPTDQRSAVDFGANNYVVSEPMILDGIEFGGDKVSREFAFRIYRVQEERFKHTGIFTAVSEDHLDQAPYFVYNTVFVNGHSWKAINDKGEDLAPFKNLSVKSVFGWDALYNTEYTRLMMAQIKTLYDPQRGWYSGLYEKDFKPNRAITANTNAIILQSLAYRRFGVLLNNKSSH